MTFTSTNADYIVLDGRYLTDQLWLNLGHTYMFYPIEEKPDAPPKPPTKKWWKMMTTRRKIGVDDEYKNLFDFSKADFLTIPMPFRRTRRVTDRGFVTTAARPNDSTKFKIHIHGEKIRNEIIYWIECNTLDLWFLSEMDSRDRIQDLHFTSSDDAMYFKLQFHDLLSKAEK